MVERENSRMGVEGGKEVPKGTVTPFAAMFPVEEARKATKQVEETIAERHNDMEHFKHLIADNSALINLVSKLPDELHHNIMVPFGKAAFFPGRLIHTNEFMVLLGEGYYAERTARQTVEILKRRGKRLDSDVESLEANIKDLRAKASFFDVTASEAAEGLVEIREDIVEEDATKTYSRSDDRREPNNKVEDDQPSNTLKDDEHSNMVEDDEYARMMARLDELEKEELEAEGDDGGEEDEQVEPEEADSESDKDKQTEATESSNESDEDEQTEATESSNESDEDEQIDAALGNSCSHDFSQNKAESNQLPLQTYSEIRRPQMQPKVGNATVQVLSDNYQNQLSVSHQQNVPMLTAKSGHVSSKSFPVAESSQNMQRASQEKARTSSQAVIGSIVEHTHNLQTTSSEAADSQPPKPISRFKMQRR